MCNFINMHYDNYIISRWKQCNYFTQMIAIATLSSNMSIIHYSLLYYVINECKQCTTASIQKNLHGNYEMSCGRCKNSSAILHQYKTHRWQRCYYSFLLSQLWIQYLLFIIFSSIVYSILLSHILYLVTQYYLTYVIPHWCICNYFVKYTGIFLILWSICSFHYYKFVFNIYWPINKLEIHLFH